MADRETPEGKERVTPEGDEREVADGDAPKPEPEEPPYGDLYRGHFSYLDVDGDYRSFSFRHVVSIEEKKASGASPVYCDVYTTHGCHNVQGVSAEEIEVALGWRRA